MTPELELCNFTEWRDNATLSALSCLPVVLDVRELWELQTAAVNPDGFTLVHIPMRSIPQRIAELRSTYGDAHPIACLCHHGIRSMRVATYLVQHGFTEVINLGGGIQAWSVHVDSGVPLY